MGMHFGDLGVKVRGIITYSISPHEQRAFAGTISRGIPNMGRRFFSQVFIIAPPMVAGYFLYNYGEKKYVSLCRKNPDDYKNDS